MWVIFRQQILVKISRGLTSGDTAFGNETVRQAVNEYASKALLTQSLGGKWRIMLEMVSWL
jgi:hypothetical protein